MFSLILNIFKQYKQLHVLFIILNSEERVEEFKRVVEDVMKSSQSSTTTQNIQGFHSSMSAHSSTHFDPIDDAEESVKGNEIPTPKQHSANAANIKDNNVAENEIRIPMSYIVQAKPLINLLVNNLLI